MNALELANKKVIYAHREDPSGCRFIGFAGRGIPPWAVDIQDYVEEEQREMNANELADELEGTEYPRDTVTFEAATMLRQLQAENEALKDKLHNVIIRSSKQVAEFENQIEELRGMLTNRDEIIDLRKAQEK